MASSNKTAKGLNQWVEADKPHMNDFNADNRLIDSLLDQRAKWVVYNSLSAIGLKIGSETMLSMAKSMKDNSTLALSVNTAPEYGFAKIYPISTGYLTINRLTQYRVETSFQHNVNPRRWIGTINAYDGTWSGWYEVMTQKVQGVAMSAPGLRPSEPAEDLIAPETTGPEQLSSETSGPAASPAPALEQAAGDSREKEAVESGLYSQAFVSELFQTIQDMSRRMKELEQNR